MDLKRGERIVAESESTERPPRPGKVEEVLGEGRYRIRWDDGHESIYTPAAGSIYRESKPRQRAGTARRSSSRGARAG